MLDIDQEPHPRACHYLSKMYPISRSVFIFIYPIWLGLGLNFVGGIVSDGNLFSIDVLGDDTGSNLFLPEVDEYSLTDQSLDTVATEDHLFDDKLLADNLLVDDRFATNLPTDNVLDDSVLSGGVQSCVQAPGRLRARENSCSNPSTPTNSDFTEEDQRVLTTEEVENYWCAKNPRKLNLGLKAVCNVQPLAGPFEEVLTSTLCQSLLSLFSLTK